VLLSVPVWSVTRATGGTATSAQASMPGSSSTAAVSRARIRGCSTAEIDRRRLRNCLFILDGEARLDLHAEDHRRQIARKRAHGRVVALHRLDVAIARDGDAVLGAFKLRLEVAEQRVGFQLGIVLDDG